MVVVNGRLDPEVGALFMRAVEAATDALYRGEKGAGGDADAAFREQFDKEVRESVDREGRDREEE